MKKAGPAVITNASSENEVNETWGVAGTEGFDEKEGTNYPGRGGDLCLVTCKFSRQGLFWGT